MEKETDIIEYLPNVVNLYDLAENWDKAGIKPNKFLIAAAEKKTGEIQRVGTVCLRTNRSDIIKCQPDFAKFMSVELILHCNSHIL